MNETAWLAMVALREGGLPPLQDVLAGVREGLPQLAGDAEVTEVRTTGHVASCRWGEVAVGITYVDRPIPNALLEGPCANAWYWPKASEAVAGHKAHLLVNVVDEAHSPIETALRLTALTSAAAHVPNAAAVLWAPAGLIHEPLAFADQAAQSSRESLPLYLWIDFRVRTQPDGRVDMFTTGLARLGKREIELAPVGAPAQQVLEWSYNLAHYLVDREAVVKDGDTIGLPDGAEFSVEHAKSRIDGEADTLFLKPLNTPVG